MNNRPLNPAKKSAFFHALAGLTAAGIPLPKAVGLAGESNPAFTKTAAVLAGALDRGAGPAFREAGFPDADCAVIEAGEVSGRLGEVFAGLAGWHRRLADARAKALSRLLYPVVLAHLAPVLLTIPRAVLAGSFAEWLRGVAWTLGGLYAIAFGLYAIWLLTVSSFRKSPAASAVLRRIPVLGAWLRTGSAARFADVFSMVVGAGGSPVKALVFAGDASGDCLLRDAARKAAAGARTGLSDALPQPSPLAPEILQAIKVGEATGRLAAECRQAAETLDARVLAMLESLSEWVPRLIYIGVLVWTGWMIVSTMLSIGHSYGEIFD